MAARVTAPRLFAVLRTSICWPASLLIWPSASHCMVPPGFNTILPMPACEVVVANRRFTDGFTYTPPEKAVLPSALTQVPPAPSDCEPLKYR